MTLFEYLSVAISIVLSLSVAQVLVNLRAVFDPAKRYWVHALWVAILLFEHILIWWGFWGYRDVESWNLATFSLALLTPGIIFVASSTLVHDGSKLEGGWEEHFFDVRKSFFVAFGSIALVAVLKDWVLSDIPIVTFGHIPELIMTTLFVAGWVSANRRVHAVLALVALVLFVTFIAFIWLQPGNGREFWH